MTTASEVALSTQAVTPMELIQRASAQGASIEQMQQLFDLKLRVEADEARKAFHEAFNAFKAESVRVVKNVKVTDGPLKGKMYADLFGVVAAVIPALSKHGLSHSWKLTKDEPTWMEATCTITHTLGHFVTAAMGAAPDTGPGRNSIQARGSAKSYLERYTLLAATGLTAENTDNDGAGAKPNMDEKDFVSFRDSIANAGNTAELKKMYTAACEAARAVKDDLAAHNFEGMKNTRYRQLMESK